MIEEPSSSALPGPQQHRRCGGHRLTISVASGAVFLFSTSSLFVLRPSNYLMKLSDLSVPEVRRSLNNLSSLAQTAIARDGELDTVQDDCAPGLNDPRPTHANGNRDPVLQPIDVSFPLKYSDLFNPALESLERFCVPWALNTDSWWTHHPEWIVESETEENLCFAKEKSHRTRLFKRLYENQFITGNCSEVHTKHMWSSGLGADLNNVIDGLRYGLKNKRPFQITFHPDDDVDPSKAWHYAALKDGSRPVCPSKDMFCYFLDLSPCEPGEPTEVAFGMDVETQGILASWMLDYVMRPQQWLRRRVFDYMRDQTPTMTAPCAAIHIRRSDVVLHNEYSRKYFAVEDYLKAMRVKKVNRKNVLLLTDDANAIEEALEFHKNYNWTYLNRKRHRGAEGGWENQLPSNDPLEEMVAILATFRMVQQCDVIVHGYSSFSDLLYYNMILAGNPVSRVLVDEGKEVFDLNNTASVEALEDRLNKKRGISYQKTKGKRNHLRP